MAVVTTRSRQTGTLVTVGRCEDVDVANDGDEAYKWATVCEEHGTFVLSQTQDLARAVKPLDFCDDCREAVKAKEAAAPVVKHQVVKPSLGVYSQAIAEGRVEVAREAKDAGYEDTYYLTRYGVYLDGERIGKVLSETTHERRLYPGKMYGYDTANVTTWTYEGVSGEKPYIGYRGESRVEAVSRLLSAKGVK